MNNPIVIIGSGFAAYQLVKSIRKLNTQQAITVITADNGDDYSKPDLSHVFTKSQTAKDLVKMRADDFAQVYNITLLRNSWLESINPGEQALICNGKPMAYHKLVLATGAKAIVPPMSGTASDDIITLNSLKDYEKAELQLANAKSVLVIGAGLIGTEIAMDLASAGRKVVMTDLAKRLLPSLLPDFIACQLYQALAGQGVSIELDTQVMTLEKTTTGIDVTLANGAQYRVDCVISAVGLHPNSQLATAAGLTTNRGIVVNRQLQTSAADIFALGDCAEIDGKVLPFLQPTLLGASVLAKTLLGQATDVQLPAMMIKVKTPLLPMQLSGTTASDKSRWQIEATATGMTAKAMNEEDQLIGFVVTQDHMKQAFPLLRQLPAMQ